MKNSALRALLASCVSWAILGCENSTASSTEQDFNASHRTISASLRASCSDLSSFVAGRALDTGVTVVIHKNPIYRLQVRVYDSMGSFLVHSESNMTPVWPTDSTGTVVKLDSACTTWIRG